MNTKVLFSTMLSLVFLLTACEKDDNSTAKPVITIHELGEGEDHGNDYTATIGGELHMDIEVVAEGKIDYIQVILHPEGDHEEEEHGPDDHDDWEIDSVYTKFSGLKNTEFHEHLKIDPSAETGHYHFDFIVTDLEGNQSSAEAEIEIVE